MQDEVSFNLNEQLMVMVAQVQQYLRESSQEQAHKAT